MVLPQPQIKFGTKHLYAIIMAGGRGEYFWPDGRKKRPKQLLPLLGKETMIAETVQRLFPLVESTNVLVITDEAYVEQIRELLPIPPKNVIGEPLGRDTAPCVALAAALVGRRDSEATMILLPADHVIHPTKVFKETLLAPAVQAQSGALVTLEITPTFPAMGYGYIHVGSGVGNGFRKVVEFREKPDLGYGEKVCQSRKLSLEQRHVHLARRCHCGSIPAIIVRHCTQSWLIGKTTPIIARILPNVKKFQSLTRDGKSGQCFGRQHVV